MADINSLIVLIDDARYALVAGNLANEMIPPEVVDRWLTEIMNAAVQIKAQGG